MGSHTSKSTGASESRNIGAEGTGLRVTLPNGKTVDYAVRAGVYRGIQNAAQTIPTGNLTNAQMAQKMIDGGSAEFLSASKVDEISKKRAEERANRPDYEMGNPFGERGRSKSIYRPRRQR